MTVDVMVEQGGDWSGRAAARRRRVARVWRDCLIAGFVGGLALSAAVAADALAWKWAFGAIALAAAAYGLWIGCVHYFRVIDDHERTAALWSGTAGLYAYVILFGANLAAGELGLVVPNAPRLIFWIVLAVTFAAFLWKRYR